MHPTRSALLCTATAAVLVATGLGGATPAAAASPTQPADTPRMTFGTLICYDNFSIVYGWVITLPNGREISYCPRRQVPPRPAA